MTRRIRVVLAGGLCLGLIGALVNAPLGSAQVSVSSDVIADTYVKIDTPDRNFGTRTSMVVAKDRLIKSQLDSYVAFSYPVPANAVKVSSARLRLIVVDGGSDIEVFSTGLFNEETLTARNVPSTGTKLGAFGRFIRSQTIDIPLATVSLSGKSAFVIKAKGMRGAFATKESATPPVLTITFETSAPSTTSTTKKTSPTIKPTTSTTHKATTSTSKATTTTLPAIVRPQGPFVPRRGALFGAFIGKENFPKSVEAVDDLEKRIGRKLDVDHQFSSWKAAFPQQQQIWDVQNGRIPMVTWEPDGTTLDAINSGQWDSMIKQRAADVKALGSPMFLRWAHEMNGNWYDWDGTHNNSPGKTDGPAKYVKAWHHMHDIFQSAGATNAVWVWCPNRMSVPSADWNHWSKYYPGDSYVDWVCVDGYNPGGMASPPVWRTFKELMTPMYNDYAHRKPFMIGETGVVEKGGDKAAWIADAEHQVKANFPGISAFLWFDANKVQDWRVDTSTATFNAFKAFAKDSYFNHWR